MAETIEKALRELQAAIENLDTVKRVKIEIVLEKPSKAKPKPDK